MNKKTMIILSVLFLLLIIGSVSASETNTTDDKVSTTDLDVNNPVGSVSNDDSEINNDSGNVLLELEDNDDEEILGSGTEYTFQDLQTLIDNTPSGGTLNLPTDNVYIGSGTNLRIDKHITINGKGSTLDAKTLSRIAYSYGGFNRAFININFVNGAGNYGGALDLTTSAGSSTTTSFINCTFENCQARGGGAIMWNNIGGNDNLIVDRCTFINNKGTDNYCGGAINIQYISGSSIVTISNSIFIGNTAPSNRGAIAKTADNAGSCTMNIYNNAFIGSTSSNNGVVNSGGDKTNFIVKNNWWGSNTPTYYSNDSSYLTANLEFKNIVKINNQYKAEFKIVFTDKSGKVVDAGFVRPVTYTTSIPSASISGDSSQAYWQGSTTNYGTITATIDNQVLKLIGVYTYDDLSSAIANNDYSSIIIMNDLTASRDITINRNGIRINGNGHIIDGVNSYRIFYGTARSNLVFKNINFINAYSYVSNGRGGGAMYFSNSDHILVQNCNFTNCKSDNQGQGGALCFQTSDGGSCTYINITHCNFNNCYSAASGGAINFHIQGHHDNYVTYCNFTNCLAGGNGGAMEFYTRSSIIDYCNFMNCNSTDELIYSWGGVGGAIVLYDGCNDVDITNCNFENNTCAKYGGAIASNSANCLRTLIDNCNFTGNSAPDGGAIYYKSSYTQMINSSFTYNTATNYGGAVYSSASDSTVNTCIFINNTASYCNHFYQGQSITFINTYFPEVYVGEDNADGDGLDVLTPGTFATGMQLVQRGGTMYIVGSLTNFKNHEITREITIKAYNRDSSINLASVSGRAFTISTSDVTIQDLTFINSRYNGDGGVLYWNGDNAYIYNCTFRNNKLSSSNGKGGAIFIGGDSDIFVIEDCNFFTNEAYNGGAIYVDDVTDNTLIYNSVFATNTAFHYGGALYYEGGICYYVDNHTSFTGNSATGDSQYDDIYDGDGATKCILDVYVSLNGGGTGKTFNSPTTFQNGFKLVAPNGKITFVNKNEIFTIKDNYHISKFNITFLGNNSTLKDLSFTINPTSYSIKFYNLIFTNNEDYTIIWRSIDGVVENCTFKDNGGNNGVKGVAIQANANNLLVKNSVFDNNKALTSGADGGAIWCNATNLRIINSNFTNNQASNAGIHIYLAESASNTIIVGSRFINGIKIGTGSAIVHTNGTIIVYNSVFENNEGDYGGALRLLSGSSNINSSSFTDNRATYGGAIYSNVPLTLTYSNFTHNQADYGGALYLSGTGNSLTNLIFERNVAKVGSAIYFNTSDYITFKKIKFTTNTATEDATVYFTSNCNVYNDENVIFTGNILPSASSLNVVVPDGVKINANVYYVSNAGGGTGLTWGNDATTLDYALSHIFEGGKIIFSQDTYEFENAITISQNIALIGNQTTLKRKNGMADKYLFIPLSQFI